jgi:hypothetical protein
MSITPWSSLRTRVAALVLIVVIPIFVTLLLSHLKHRRQDIERAGADALNWRGSHRSTTTGWSRAAGSCSPA